MPRASYVLAAALAAHLRLTEVPLASLQVPRRPGMGPPARRNHDDDTDTASVDGRADPYSAGATVQHTCGELMEKARCKAEQAMRLSHSTGPVDRALGPAARQQTC